MPLDATKPADSEQVANLPRYIRETRAALINDGIPNAVFEAGVQDGDAVWLDPDFKIWRMSRAGHATRHKFHGIASVTNSLVQVFGQVSYDRWAFTEQSTVYVSATNNGELTSTDTGLIAGVAIALDTLLLDSQISASFSELMEEIKAARDGRTGLHERLIEIDDSLLSLVTEMTAARGANPAVANRFTAIESEILAARDGQNSLAAKLSLFDGLYLEIVDARAGKATLKLTLDDLGALIAAVQAEVMAGRGSSVSLNSRLSVSINPDGTLKQTVTASNWVDVVGSVVYVNGNTLRITGDYTAVMEINRALKLNGSIICYVVSASYEAPNTTVIIQRGTVPNPLTALAYSFSPSELPLYAHSDLGTIDGADATSTDAVKNKHISNAQAKSWTDLVTSVSTTAAPSKVPQSDGAGKLAHGWLPAATQLTPGGAKIAKLLTVLRGLDSDDLTPPLYVLMAQSNGSVTAAATVSPFQIMFWTL